MAIKVNGTTVINDSRALSNIASVDATTAASMGAAGVGGAHTLIQGETSFTSTPHPEFDISSGGYGVYYIDFIALKHNNASAQKSLVMRFFNSSNTRIDTSTYNIIGKYHGQNVSFRTTNNKGFFSNPAYDDWSKTATYDGTAFVSIEVRNSNSSTIPTMLSYKTFFADTQNVGEFYPRWHSEGYITLQSTVATPKFALACDTFSTGSTITGKYRAWALK